MNSVSKIKLVSVFGLLGCLTVSAMAQIPTDGKAKDSSPAPEYKPHEGEQPVFGKKFRPEVVSRDLVLEINPMVLLVQGISAEFEKRGGDKWSWGVDMQYRNSTIYDNDNVKARFDLIGVGPKVRIYPYESLNGVFVGGKLSFSVLSSVISAKAESDKTQFLVAPSVHAGYRFVADNGFTFAAYLGGGINLIRPEFKAGSIRSEDNNNLSVEAARKKLNESVGLFQPDFGLTLGIAL